MSLSTHCVLANDMGNYDMAYELFSRAARIDLGENMKTSDHGIHAASLGGIWQCVVNGFGGVRMVNGNLRINPNLPKAWNELHFSIYWHGDRLEVSISKNSVTVENITRKNDTLELLLSGKQILLKDKVTLDLVKA